jgi:flagellin
MSNVESYTEKLVATESTMRDVDFASETADLSRNQVFQQAGVAILSQANQSPQAALSLLQ